MKDVLEFDGIELNYGTRRILSGVYMKCVVGEIVGVLGRNGSGKSSLFKVVIGSQAATYRSVRVNGNPVPSDFVRKRLIAYLPQSDLIPPYVTIGKAIDLFEIDKTEVLELFPELEKQLSLRPNELSGGYRRLVELMLVLKSRSRFCLLDEPFSGVMPVHVERIQQLLKDACKDKGIILTDHLYRNVMATAERVYVLSNGSTYLVKNADDLVLRGYLSNGQ